MTRKHDPLIRMATPADAAALLSIYGPLVRETAITFEQEPPTVDVFGHRMLSVLAHYPWLVCEHHGALVGYAYAASHRTRAAYRWSVETSTYVHAGHRRKGVAHALYRSLFALLELQGFYMAYAGIALPNPPSVALHTSFGFTEVGTFRAVGYKLGKWQDVAWWQRALQDNHSTPIQPPRTPQELEGTMLWEAALSAGQRDLKL